MTTRKYKGIKLNSGAYFGLTKNKKKLIVSFVSVKLVNK